MRYDVAIIGYGPTGATLANQLGQAGLSVVVFERETAVYRLPRAIHFDGEVMRVFQNIGLKKVVEGISRPGLKGMHFVNPAGQTLLVRGGSALRGPHGCANNYYFHQPELEMVLRLGVTRYTNVHVHVHHEVFALHPDTDGVTLRYENSADGTLGECRAGYVIGCDGARSLTRRVMDSPMDDLGLHQPWLVFDVLLREGRGGDLPDHTQQICDPARPMTFCNVVGPRRRWEIMLLPGDDVHTVARAENVWSLVSRWITPEDAELERAAVYTFHSVIARRWRGKGDAGRLLLAGDAAHQTPPFLGQGMCAGIRDAANLAWKLVLVAQGRAPATLLDTYESERAPHVRAFIELAVKLGDIIQTTDPAVAAERDREFMSGAPEVFVFPSPSLGPGLHSDAPAPVGLSFPQPDLPDGTPLDTALGQRFAVIAEAAVLAAVSPATRTRWQALDVHVLPVDAVHGGAQIAAWLVEHQVRGVILRPDRYIMGTVGSAAELDALSEGLPVAV